MTEFDTAVLVGRFQPFHAGHAGLLRVAMGTAPRVVVVLGSAHGAPSVRNPFTAPQREAMIRSTLDAQENERVLFVARRDVWDARRWAQEVQREVEALAPGRIALVGYHKDWTSGYLDTFPGWTFVDANRQGPLDATPLREHILSHAPWDLVESELRGNVHDSTLVHLSRWASGSIRAELAADLQAIRDYQSRWGKGPFLTVDAVAMACGHVLLIRRGARPGKGLRAIPGGFLEAHEGLEDAAKRELLEETGLDLGDVRATKTEVFGHPSRSARARIVTHAFLFEPNWSTLPEVEGLDDAEDASWIPVERLASMESEFFGDHFHILDRLVGVLERSPAA